MLLFFDNYIVQLNRRALRSRFMKQNLNEGRALLVGKLENDQVRLPEVVALALSESLDLHGISSDTSIRNMFDVSYIDEGMFVVINQLSVQTILTLD
ncbi:unnamed protein product [Angiostrongylus costaricensis]|uniref:ABC transporter ATP-binding protein n=1 Tax=Angiostrongylus costaricensis TaxID=334426 RepID=A0A0R3PEG0_ANGCS|nr:unnamed protein product [Angiostrongylus costaricensis]